MESNVVAPPRTRVAVSVALFFFGTLVLLALVYPRFALNDRAGASLLPALGPESYVLDNGRELSDISLDQAQYLMFTEWFAGKEVADDEFIAPYVYRPLLPYVAAALPTDAATAWAILNSAMLVAGLGALVLTLRVLDLGPFGSGGAVALFTVNWSVLNYGSTPYIDPALVALLQIGLLLILARRRALFLVALVLGLLVKESFVLVVPIAFVAWLRPDDQTRAPDETTSSRRWWIATTVVLSLAVLATARMIAPPFGRSISGLPSNSFFGNNISRPNAWLVVAFVAAIPLYLAWKGIGELRRTSGLEPLHLRHPITAVRVVAAESPSAPWIRFLPVAAGLALSVLYFLYACISANVDGRLVWSIVPFALPLAAVELDRLAADRQIGARLRR